MNKDQILTRVEDIFRELFDDYEGPVTPELSANDVEQWDSLGHIQFVVMVEKTFGLKFELEQVNALPNLGGLVSLIESKM